MGFCQRALSQTRRPQLATSRLPCCLYRPHLVPRRLSPGITRAMSTAMDQKLNALQSYSACDVGVHRNGLDHLLTQCP